MIINRVSSFLLNGTGPSKFCQDLRVRTKLLSNFFKFTAEVIGLKSEIPDSITGGDINALMSESLRNDGRIWVPDKVGDKRAPGDIPEDERDYYLERRYPAFGNLAPRDISSRSAKYVCDEAKACIL